MILGIDIGAGGVVVVLNSEGKLVDVSDMPCRADGAKGRKTVNAPLLAEIVFRGHARQTQRARPNSRSKAGRRLLDLGGRRSRWTKTGGAKNDNQPSPHE